MKKLVRTEKNMNYSADAKPKLECSERISPFLDLENNRSESFNHTVTAIRKLIET